MDDTERLKLLNQIHYWLQENTENKKKLIQNDNNDGLFWILNILLE